MKTNIGPFDAGVRSMLGGIFILSTAHDLGWWALLGVVPIVTATLAFCPLYWLIGIDTDCWEECGKLKRRRPALAPSSSTPKESQAEATQKKKIHSP